MDLTSTEPSPAPSDSTPSGWGQVDWEDEGSLQCLRRDSSNRRELQGLVEDKEIAAHAVAFVVNSSRKGIVPLCADVANLMRSKKCLEQRINILKTENESLRQSHLGSASLSSPASLRSFLQDTHHSGLPQERCCSRSSCHCGGLASSSPRFHHQLSPSAYAHLPGTHAPSAFTVHKPASSSTPQGGGVPHGHGHCRKGSLPEMVSEPLGNITKVLPHALHSCKGTQCSLEDSQTSACLQEQLQQLRQHNLQLETELGETRRQLTALKQAMEKCKTQSSASPNNQKPEKFQLVNECDVSIPPPEAKRTLERRPSATLIIPVLLEGCQCLRCVGTSATDVEKNGMTHSQLSSSLQVAYDDYVTMTDGRAGHVRYIGHVDNIGQTDGVYVGLELDTQDGNHDGSIDGKRYFTCGKHRGVLVPVREVARAIRNRSHSSPGGSLCRSRSADALHSDIVICTSPKESAALTLKLPRARADGAHDIV